MDTNRTIARIVGTFYIAATVASSLTVVMLTPILDAPDYLVRFSATEFQVSLALLLMLVDVFCVVGIGVMMYPILKRHNESLALGTLRPGLSKAHCLLSMSSVSSLYWHWVGNSSTQELRMLLTFKPAAL